ncbi:MAG TPA: GMC family oxidoreductase [Candidatus Saccharimonadales bacterium]|jgi:choline dehydrogenase-like flavoprotein|nr:GMC family oxidoreductase [Candidatus Saccharimonadales bacterium]
MRVDTPKYKTSDEVDFVIVGSGAAGGIMAKELSTNGFRVVVLEQGPYLTEADFVHDEVKVLGEDLLTNKPKLQPTSFRKTPNEKAKPQHALVYGRLVGGTSVHFTANFWRFHEVDFVERSKIGPVPGADLRDWPITYADLEPYYTKVEWEIGVSGLAGASPFDPPRSKPYPMPPLPVKGCGVVFERAARKLGWHPFPAPMAILSQPRAGRGACVNCGFCLAFGCEVGAKSSSLAAAIPVAEKTGRCEIRPNSYVHRIEMDNNGRVTGAVYFDEKRNTHLQKAQAVIVCANGAETPRLLLLSANKQFPNGLANSSGIVGKYLMLNSGGITTAVFEHPLNDYKGFAVSRILHDFYELDPQKVGFYGGGGLDARFDMTPLSLALENWPEVWRNPGASGQQGGLPPASPRWGKAFKDTLAHNFSRTMEIFAHGTSLPVETNSFSLDPDLKDAWGLPALCLTYKDHPDDLKLWAWQNQRAHELLDAAGAQKKWSHPITESEFAVHLLGTCRMGNDSKTSVINSDHRTHDIKNLFLCDGSSLVTSGRGQPTMTIEALAFRAADRITALAKRGEIT